MAFGGGAGQQIRHGRYRLGQSAHSPVLAGTAFLLHQSLHMGGNLDLNPLVVAAHMVGKHHLGYASWQHTPTFRGFDSFLGYYSGDADYFTHDGDCGGFDLRVEYSPRCGANCSRSMWEARGVYSTHLFSDRAVAIVGAHDPARDGALFLYLPFQAIHVPDQVPAA